MTPEREYILAERIAIKMDSGISEQEAKRQASAEVKAAWRKGR